LTRLRKEFDKKDTYHTHTLKELREKVLKMSVYDVGLIDLDEVIEVIEDAIKERGEK
jgi:hypothetical protein